MENQLKIATTQKKNTPQFHQRILNRLLKVYMMYITTELLIFLKFQELKSAEKQELPKILPV